MLSFKLLAILSYFLVAFSCCNSSLIKSSDWDLEEVEVEIPALVVRENPTTETSATTLSETSAKPLVLSASVISDYEEPEATGIQNGKFFRLMMTIVQDWNDEFMDRESEKFLSLANNLSDELTNLASKSQVELIKFKLVEVLPAKKSLQNVYVTFVVSSENELNGEDLNNSILNQILIYEKIVHHKATNEGFTMENISEDTAKELVAEKESVCQSAGTTTDPSMVQEETSATSTVTSSYNQSANQDDHSHHFDPKCHRDKIQRGSTSIYIFETRQDSDKVNMHDSEKIAVQADDTSNTGECMKNFKRSAINNDGEKDETLVIIRKRGNKVFIEI